MTWGRSIALPVGAIAAMAGVSLGASSGTPPMHFQPVGPGAPLVAKPPARSPDSTEMLFLGDMSLDAFVSCQPPTGPNEWATRVTASLTPQFGIVSTTYEIAGTAQTTWDLVAWNDGPTPGAEIQRCPLGPANGTPGIHTVAVPAGCLTIPAAAGQTFFFGLSQGADATGMPFGQDTNGATTNTVYIRSPNCGLPTFAPVEALGFPGYWVHSITVDDTVPVELMSFSVR